jgi:multicomponent K+:H+ antiporter subunit G
MNGELSPVVAVLVSMLVVAGAALTLVGSLGLLRFHTFYERVHPPTLGTTLGVAFVLLASMLLFSTLRTRPVIHEIVIAVFVVLTTPVTFMLLMRAARHRDGTD